VRADSQTKSKRANPDRINEIPAGHGRSSSTNNHDATGAQDKLLLPSGGTQERGDRHITKKENRIIYQKATAAAPAPFGKLKRTTKTKPTTHPAPPRARVHAIDDTVIASTTSFRSDKSPTQPELFVPTPLSDGCCQTKQVTLTRHPGPYIVEKSYSLQMHTPPETSTRQTCLQHRSEAPTTMLRPATETNVERVISKQPRVPHHSI